MKVWTGFAKERQDHALARRHHEAALVGAEGELRVRVLGSLADLTYAEGDVPAARARR